MNKLFWFITVVVFGYMLACKIVDWRANVNYKKEIAKSTTTIADITKMFTNVKFSDPKDKNQVSNDEYQKVNNLMEEFVEKHIADSDDPKLKEKISKIYQSKDEALRVINNKNESLFLKHIARSALVQAGVKNDSIKVIIDELGKIREGTSIEHVGFIAQNAYSLCCRTNLTIPERIALVSELIKSFNWLTEAQENGERIKVESGAVLIKLNNRVEEDSVCIITEKIHTAKAIIAVGYKIPDFDYTPFLKYIFSTLENERFYKGEYIPVSVESVEALGDLGVFEAIPVLKKVLKICKQNHDDLLYEFVGGQIQRIRIKNLTHGRIDI